MQRLFPLATIGLGLGLVVVGLGGVVLPELSATIYGVPAEETTWVAAAGWRDVVLGAVVLTLVAFHPGAVWSCLPAILLLPVADAALVAWAGKPLAATLPHVAGAVAIVVLIELGRRAYATA